MTPKYVYVVEFGMYSSRGVVGVYDTPEAAMADHQIPSDYKYPKIASGANMSEPGGWRPSTYAESGQRWENGLDWDDHGCIERYEVKTTSSI